MAYLTDTTRPALMTSPLTSRNAPVPQTGSATPGVKQPAFWAMTGTDAVTTVRVDGFITDAEDLGMQKGDILWYIDTDASPITAQIMIVSAINANGSADLSDGTAVTATDSD